MKREDIFRIPFGTLLESKYRIEGIIGEGGMGIVYEATQVSIGRKVAVKYFNSIYADNPRMLFRFQQEAQAAGAIGHDNICEVTDLGKGPDGAPYFVMPLLRGSTLYTVLRQYGKLRVDQLVDIGCQVLSALEAAHRSGIIHRDLKPANIFISKVGDRDNFVKLLDFGVSKMISEDAPSDLTRTGAVMGTSNYMSPEQAKGSKHIDRRADIYAMGVVLYEGLTCKRPFEGDSYNEVMYKILCDDFESPRSLEPSVPIGVEEVILKAMSREPDDRYSSASKMRNALLKLVPAGGMRASTSPPITATGEVSPASLAQSSFSSPDLQRTVEARPSSHPSRTPVSSPPSKLTVSSRPPPTPSTSPPPKSTAKEDPIPGLFGVLPGKPSRFGHEIWVHYAGKEILIRNYSGLTRKNVAPILEASIESTNELIAMDARDLLIISDVTGGFADKKATEMLKKLGAKLRPHTKKLAVVGASGIQKLLVHAVTTFSGIGIATFETRKEAAEWLVED